jgi:hypothetical protein
MTYLEYGKAESALKALSASSQISPDIKKKVNDLQEKLNKRIDEVISLSKEFAENDPILSEAYSKYFLKQVTGHSRSARKTG